MLSRKARSCLVLAQLLGFFPAKGIWGAVSTNTLNFKRLSIPFIYGLITLIVRVIATIIVSNFIHIAVIPRSKPIYLTDYVTTVAGLIFTFCTGTTTQVLILSRTSNFILTLQKMEEFDALYPADKSKKQKGSIGCSFLTHNLIFLFFTVTIPLSVVIGILLFPSHAKSFGRFEDGVSKGALQHPFLTLAIYTILSLVMESASAFLVFQLAFFITALENRLQTILDAVIENTDSNSMFDLFLDFCVKSKWADKKLKPKPCQGSDIIAGPQFWKKISKKYLDFNELFSAFTSFAGAYFVVVYPLQIFSSVCMLYIIMTDVLEVEEEATFISISLKVIMTLGIWRIWSLSDIGQGIEKIHSQILRRILAVDTDMIPDENEKDNYQRFVRILKSISIQLNASGFFNVSRSNIPSIITAVLSYIIVLLLFKSSEKSPAINFPWNDTTPDNQT